MLLQSVPQPPPELRNVISLDNLSAISPSLLDRLLAKFGPEVAVFRDAIANDPWLGTTGLYQALAQADSPVPLELRHALLAISDVANDTGHEHLLAIAHATQLPLQQAFNERAVSPSELACVAYLDHPALFAAVAGCSESGDMRRFVDFEGSRAGIDAALAVAKRSELVGLLGAWFASRNRTAFNDVRVSTGADEISFLVIHGSPASSHGAVTGLGTDSSYRLVSYARARHDLIVFRKKAGILSINAQSPADREFYRRIFGRVFFGSDFHFLATSLYSAAPLVEAGAASLSPHGIPDLSRVCLRQLRASFGGGRRTTLEDAEDLTLHLEAPDVRFALHHGQLVSLTMALTITGRTQPLLVEVVPPNCLSFDRRVAAHVEVVHLFLAARGFAGATKATSYLP